MARLAALGRFLFRHRDVLPVPLAVAVALSSRIRGGRLVSGALLVLTGLAIRLWAVLYIGEQSRSRGDGPAFRTIGGPYAYFRHPLYLANGVLSEGLVLFSGAGKRWLPFVFPVLAFLFYVPIVAWEQGRVYRRGIPVMAHRFGVRTALCSERRTYQSVLAFLLVSVVSSFVRNNFRRNRQ
ncbi:MAG TPA: methyltransferase [Candidatus Latescibacteria bacterium]|nr:methyltransferase [Candidatus Latescibacterota bacterium]